MRLAIDVGNTDTKFGLADGEEWLGIWRRPTHDGCDANQIVDWLANNVNEAGLPLQVQEAACVSVVPEIESVICDVAKSVTGLEPVFLRPALVTRVKVLYEPADSLGPDRLANALGALKEFAAPVIVVDFGTATTLDVCSEEGFLGGAILPGVKLQLESLAQGTSKLSEVEARVPPLAIGRSTKDSLQSGVVLGHVAAVEGLILRMQKELPKPATVIGTGGLSHLFIGATESIHHFVPQLTLQGVLTILDG
jgi:type III pantothenate kinase